MTTVLHIDNLKQEISLINVETGQELKKWNILDTDNTWSERFAEQFEIER